MSENTKLSYLFDIYASDLHAHAPSFKDTFVCPLCLREVPRVADLREVVSEEHIVPGSIGGRLTTLTCRKCNVTGGSQLDADLVQRVRVGSGDYPISSRVSIGEGEFGAGIFFSTDEDSPNRIVGIPKQSDPRLVEVAHNALESGVDEISLKLRFGYNPRSSLVGLIRIAYLMLFRCFGYRYILQDFVEQVRRQIESPFEETPVLKGVRWDIGSMPVKNVITIIKCPRDLRSFFIILELLADAGRCSGVILPGLGQKSGTVYERLEGQTGRVNLEVVPVTKVPPKPDTILDPFKAWQTVFRPTEVE
jgi:hypothetical protein